jgi:hypothetical protein
MENKNVKRGRKPVADKKKMVTVYLKESIIKKNGGLQELKHLIHEKFDNDYTRAVILIVSMVLFCFADNIF